MMHLNRDSAIQSSSRGFCTIYKSEKSDPLQSSGRRHIPSGRSSIQSIIRPDDKNFPSGPSSVSRSFKLLQFASVRTFQQHVRTTLSVRPAMGFNSKTQIWEDHCSCSDDVDSRLDALIHKASCAFKIQMSGRQPSWSECRSYLYVNCVQPSERPFPWIGCAKAWYENCVQLKCDCPDDRATPSRCGSNQERISAKFWKADRTVVRPDALCPPSRRRLGLSSQMLIWTCSL
jgi:hypothetical protein